jgi:hypothetical protein
MNDSCIFQNRCKSNTYSIVVYDNPYVIQHKKTKMSQKSTKKMLEAGSGFMGTAYANFLAPSLMTTSYTFGDTPNLALKVS